MTPLSRFEICMTLWYSVAYDGGSMIMLSRTSVSDPVPSNVVAGPNPAVLRAITNGRVGLVLWWRALCPTLEQIAADLLAGPLFDDVASGMPDEAAGALTAPLHVDVGHLRSDVEALARLFSELAHSSCVRIRLAHVADQTRHELRTDAVRLRLLCTYAGLGTEWEDARGTVRRMPEGHVAVLKGTRWLGCDDLVRQRPPTPARLPRSERHRLLLVVDQPDLN